jgi:2-polyprenyl-3-methyl-5-hydroxy-6-metoxy-1,4-benzoquinol methylase
VEAALSADLSADHQETAECAGMTPDDDYSLFTCELCGSDDFAEIVELREHTAGQPIHVCRVCGFVQVIRRRNPERIAEVWAKELYQSEYTARIPAVKARHIYVAETIDVAIGLRGKSVCDIGAGEGFFLEILRDQYAAEIFGVEPSTANCARMTSQGIDCFDGTAEQFMTSAQQRRFDIVTVIWTLENSNSCRQLMDAAWHLLRDDGYVVVATGSRILVPFKKPLDYYLGPNPADTHSFRFSANTLNGLLAETGFERTYVNHYIDSDVLCMIASRTDRSQPIAWSRDDWRRVNEFFSRWHQDTVFYKTA